MKLSSIRAYAGKAAMNRALILLLFGVLAGAWPGGAVAEGQQATGNALTKLMVLFSWSASRFAVPKAVVSPEKDWAMVTDAQSRREARLKRERRLREAREQVLERERELRVAREVYRRETSRMVQAPDTHMDRVAADRVTQSSRLALAERRLSEREREAYKAKLEFSRAAREVREQRRLNAQRAESDS